MSTFLSISSLLQFLFPLPTFHYISIYGFPIYCSLSVILSIKLLPYPFLFIYLFSSFPPARLPLSLILIFSILCLFFCLCISYSYSFFSLEYGNYTRGIVAHVLHACYNVSLRSRGCLSTCTRVRVCVRVYILVKKPNACMDVRV